VAAVARGAAWWAPVAGLVFAAGAAVLFLQMLELGRTRP
jgi:hypothetical protein